VVIADSDRHFGNVVVAADSGMPIAIDRGFAGQGDETGEVLAPYANTQFQPMTGRDAQQHRLVDLDLPTRHWLRTHVDPDDITAAQKAARDRIREAGASGSLDTYVASKAFRRAMKARLESATTNGMYSFTATPS
jgi:hypothetical protein